MVLTIIGETIPENNRANVIGKINTSNPTLSTFAGLTIAYLLRSGWQSAYLMYVFPIMLVSLIFAVLFLPQISQIKETEKSTSIREGFNSIIGYRSALICLFGSTLTRLVFGGMMWYVVSFYKVIWGISTSNVGLIWSANTFIFVIGNLISGGIVSRIGYKRSTSLSSLILGLCFIVFTNVSIYHVAVAVNLFFSFVAAFWMTGASALALSQVPEYKGAMMSLHSGSIQLGNALGSALGGLFITIGGYGLMGIFMGILAILASLSVSNFARDPIKLDFSS
jgi:predicted MFS family arabinose efflux permease